MTKRVFAAIDISDEARREVSRYVESLKREFSAAPVSWEKPEKLHLTLKFVGEIEDERLKGFVAATKRAAREFSRFNLQIEGAGVFPSPRNARVLWFGLKDEANALARLNETLERECQSEGFVREKRSFKPHLTIGRIKVKPDESLIRRHLASDFASPVPFPVPEIVVYQSELSPAGSKYSAISRAAFKSLGEN